MTSSGVAALVAVVRRGGSTRDLATSSRYYRGRLATATMTMTTTSTASSVVSTSSTSAIFVAGFDATAAIAARHFSTTPLNHLLAAATESQASLAHAPSASSSAHPRDGRLPVVLAVASAAFLASASASCEALPPKGPANESDSFPEARIIVGDDDDGINAGSRSSPNDGSTGHADEAEGGRKECKDDDDDPSEDEETSCSICLINRQGPCRKFWLKFERCMKEHQAEKEKAEAKEAVERREKAKDETAKAEMKAKDKNPKKDDAESNVSADELLPSSESETLASKCDRYMIPWIGCIQEHRNAYSLISNAFYQKDYVDPLEDGVPDERRRPFPGEDEGKSGDGSSFFGVHVDLGNWREHVEADDIEGWDEEDEERDVDAAARRSGDAEPRLINAYARFRLTEPGESGRPIEVAYVKDQNGRILGFDSFSKRDDKITGGDEGEEDAPSSTGGNPDGECTFYIVPGETTSIKAFAIYRDPKMDDRGESESAPRTREDWLYCTPSIPLTGCNINNEGKN